MSDRIATSPAPSRSRRLQVAMLVITVLLCGAALLFRAPLRARYWAWRLAKTTDLAERNAYAAGLCGAGDASRWAVAALLGDSDPDIRQYGVLVLQHVRGAWATAALLGALRDPEPYVARLAAVGLALAGDDRVVPTLEDLYGAADDAAADMATLALERLGTPAARAALVRLVQRDASAAARAGAIDALAALRAREAIRPLLAALDDERPCPTTPRRDELAAQALAALQSRGLAVTSRWATSRVATGTVADRAAAALQAITNAGPSSWSDLTAQEHHDARAAWEVAPATSSGGP